MAKTVGRLLPRNLKFRLTSVVMVLVLAAAVLVTLVALALAERDMKAIIGDQQYALLSSAAAVIDDRIETRKLIVAALADTLPAEVRAEPARVQAWLAAHVKLGGYFLNVVAFDARGKLVASLVPPSRVNDLNVAERPYFKQALAAGAPVLSAPIRSALSGAAMVLVSVPVRDAAGKVALVLVGGIDLQRSSFLPEIEALKPGKTGFIFIMTATGVLIEHPDKTRLLEHVNARPDGAGATARALAGFEGWTESTNSRGVDGIYSFKRLKAADWIVGARYPTDEAFAPMIAMRRHAVLGAAGLAALAGLLAWLAINGLLAPLEALRRQVAEIRAGRAGIEVLRTRADDEIGELGAAFHQLMAEREAAKARTDERERLIRDILERAPDAFVACDRAGLITEWNARAEETFGWTRAEAVGRALAELLIPAALRPPGLCGMDAFARSGTGIARQGRVRVDALHRDGHEVQIELSVGALQHGGAYSETAFLRDIADRLAYEERISAGARRARIIADSMPALIAYVDRDQRYELTNAHYRDLLGIDPATMIGRSVREMLGAASHDTLAPHIARALRGERVHFEYAGQRDGGAAHYMIDYLPDLGADGAVAGFYLLALDISARKRGELAQAASEKRLTLITDNLPVLIFYIDREHVVRFANATLERWFGVKVAAVLGRPLAELMRADDFAVTLPHLARARAGEAVNFVLNVAVASGARILETSFVPDLQADGSVAGVYALAQDVTRMKDVEERLMQLARSDSLTGIANRRLFGELLPMALERARRHQACIAIAYLDIDHFKQINDSSGHAIGDEVLREFARRLLANVRATDTVARLSGDEFVILFEDVAGEQEALRIAVKLTEAVRQPFATSRGPLRVSTSVGVAIQGDPDQAPESLLANADQALYQAKREGRDRVAVYG
jgi:diguanylate cyclase (GGDEF)-like protein/PAS domain S-box-containing protein